MKIYKLIGKLIITTLSFGWALPAKAYVSPSELYQTPEIAQVAELIKNIYYESTTKQYTDGGYDTFYKTLNLSYDEEGNRTLSYNRGIVTITFTKNIINAKVDINFREFKNLKPIPLKNISLANYKYVNKLNKDYPTYKFSLIPYSFNKNKQPFGILYVTEYKLVKSTCSTSDCMKNLIKFLVVSKNKYNEIAEYFYPNSVYRF